MQLSNFIGRSFLKNSNARTSCPPGKLMPNGNRSIIVASPMRSGTHLAIDLILNSLPTYRRKPLYVVLDHRDFDAYAKTTDLHHAGYIVKTHFPNGNREQMASAIQNLAKESVVVVVRRPVDDIRKSLIRWRDAEPGLKGISRQLENLDGEIIDFERFWKGFSPYVIEYSDLFDPQNCRKIVTDIAKLADCVPRERSGALVPVRSKHLVYINKALTRVFGRHAPRIDTTIRSLR